MSSGNNAVTHTTQDKPLQSATTMKYDHINILCHMKLAAGHSCLRHDGACGLILAGIAEEAALISA